MNNNNLKEITLEEVVNELLEEQKKGNMVAMSYKDKMFFSQSITMDAAYLEVYGMTKATYDHMVSSKNQIPSIDKEEVESIMEEGKLLIYPERLEEWSTNMLDLIFTNKNWKKLINLALEIMNMLERGDSIDDTLGVLLASTHDRKSLEIIREIIFSFSKRGPEFYLESTLDASPELELKVNNKIKENQKLENNQIQTKTR